MWDRALRGVSSDLNSRHMNREFRPDQLVLGTRVKRSPILASLNSHSLVFTASCQMVDQTCQWLLREVPLKMNNGLCLKACFFNKIICFQAHFLTPSSLNIPSLDFSLILFVHNIECCRGVGRSPNILRISGPHN